MAFCGEFIIGFENSDSVLCYVLPHSPCVFARPDWGIAQNVSAQRRSKESLVVRLGGLPHRIASMTEILPLISMLSSPPF